MKPARPHTFQGKMERIHEDFIPMNTACADLCVFKFLIFICFLFNYKKCKKMSPALHFPRLEKGQMVTQTLRRRAWRGEVKEQIWRQRLRRKL